MRFSERRLEVFIGANVGYIIEIMDQWYGPGYRYVKVRGHDGSVYLLRLDEINDQCELIMFSAARVQRLATRITRPGSA